MKIKIGDVCRVIVQTSWARGWLCIVEDIVGERLYCRIFNSYSHTAIEVPGERYYFRYIGSNDLICFINEL